MESVGKWTVCVIEDEPITRMDAVLLLEEAGFEVKEFVVVDKAVAYLETQAAVVTFVFSWRGGQNGGRRHSHRIRKCR